MDLPSLYLYPNGSALSAACSMGLEYVQLFLQQRCHADLRPPVDEKYRFDTPLCEAAKLGKIDIVELLLQHNASVSPHFTVQSPLVYAVQSGNLECVKAIYTQLEKTKPFNYSVILTESLITAFNYSRLNIVQFFMPFGYD